ncbi:hypothetical protein ACM74Z_19415 [Pseudomonas aeruginosa]|uniref:hypothetical protein n=1 Tax=Pseudomonas aeruginosa TaxID=287 RepID=UPI001A1EB873|nr:hypothetical protein [Pseudomonas aeruginosa]MBG7114982.1 hypothetical protein [Pseudomonas aeruginosa]MBI7984023.1 hypothetical protein [Pseudomonas aeruginosa]MCW5464722.1 hypothetical protein [Pseudomonas aeruginosa]
MKSKEVVKAIFDQIQEVKKQGNTVVTVDSLEGLLAALDRHIDSQEPLEQASFEFQKQTNEFHYQSSQELFRSVINSGQSALKTSILVGGGAAAALLAFASSAWKALKPEGLDLLGGSVLLLSLGVVLTAIATGFNYLAQFFYYDAYHADEETKWHDRLGGLFNFLSSALVVVSYAFYVWACWRVYLMMHAFYVVKGFPVP